MSDLGPRLAFVAFEQVMEYCAREAAQIFGGLSYSRGGQGEKVERLNREVRAMAIPGGCLSELGAGAFGTFDGSSTKALRRSCWTWA